MLALLFFSFTLFIHLHPPPPHTHTYMHTHAHTRTHHAHHARTHTCCSFSSPCSYSCAYYDTVICAWKVEPMTDSDHHKIQTINKNTNRRKLYFGLEVQVHSTVINFRHNSHYQATYTNDSLQYFKDLSAEHCHVLFEKMSPSPSPSL